MIGIEINNTDFKNAILTRANLTNLYLENANFRGADFSSADLSGADLRGTNLIRVNLKGANLDSAIIDSNTQIFLIANSLIPCPWDDINDEQFEQLCYDIIKEKHQPNEIHKMGKSRSRDGGRDIEFYKSTSINNQVKWIVQCKLIKNEKSLSGKSISDIPYMLGRYNARGFCVMTSGVIDSTLHEKLEYEKNTNGFDIEKWSYLEIERFLAEHPEIRERYFKD
jgi:hypothetical protein